MKKKVIAIVQMPKWVARVFEDGSVCNSAKPDAEIPVEEQIAILRRAVAAQGMALAGDVDSWAMFADVDVTARVRRPRTAAGSVDAVDGVGET